MRPTRWPTLALLLVLSCLSALAPPRASAGPPRSPVFYDTTEGLATLLTTHFANDFAALVTAKSLTGLGLDTSVTVYPFREASDWAGHEHQLPGVGVFLHTARTQAKSNQQRDNQLVAIAEYMCRGTDSALIRKQTYLASEVLLLFIDRIAGSGGGVEGGGEEPASVLLTVDGSYPTEAQDVYEGYVSAEFPVWETDQIA